MAKKLKPELSEKNEYYIDKHRFYELKHFCMQYPEWRREYYSIDGLAKCSYGSTMDNKNRNHGDPTVRCFEARQFYAERIDLLEEVSLETDPIIGAYILKAITKGLSYDTLKALYDIPCGREMYYKLYRKFFWLLSKRRK